MKCVEDQIKDNIGFGQAMSDLGWMGREEVAGEAEEKPERRLVWLNSGVVKKKLKMRGG